MTRRVREYVRPGHYRLVEDEVPRRQLPVRWSYGVTTVPMRRDSLLPRTLRSLRDAGFDRPHLFVDGDPDGAAWRSRFCLEVTTRHPAARTFGNWVLSLGELYVRDPMADRFAVFQDDFVTYKNLRSYLEACPYPARGYWNLYTFPRNQELSAGRMGWYPSDQLGKGAVALVFDRQAVITLLSHTHMIERPLNAHRGHKSVDGGIVTALKKAGWTEYVHSPSLVQHTGLQSSMGNKVHPLAPRFLGEGYDAMELLKATK